MLLLEENTSTYTKRKPSATPTSCNIRACVWPWIFLYLLWGRYSF